MLARNDEPYWDEPDEPEDAPNKSVQIFDPYALCVRATQNTLLTPFVVEMMALGFIIGLSRAMMR